MNQRIEKREEGEIKSNKKKKKGRPKQSKRTKQQKDKVIGQIRRDGGHVASL